MLCEATLSCASTAHARGTSSGSRNGACLMQTAHLLVEHEAELLCERSQLLLPLRQPAALPVAITPLRRAVALLRPARQCLDARRQPTWSFRRIPLS